MATIKAEDYYAAHKDQEKEYAHVYLARAVKNGDAIMVSVAHRDLAPEDGYALTDYSTPSYGFANKETLSTAFELADDLGVPLKKMDAPAGAFVPVHRGEIITAAENPADGVYAACERPAEYDGVMMFNQYLTNFQLTSQFNYAGQMFTSIEEHIVRLKSEPLYKGVIVTKGVELIWASGEKSYVRPGTLLVPNPDDSDGFSILTPKYSANLSLRVAKSKGPTVG